MNKYLTVFFISLFWTVPGFSDSFLSAQSFPKTFNDTGFTERVDFLEDDYQDFADLSAYDILNIVYTDKNIDAEIEEDAENPLDELMEAEQSMDDEIAQDDASMIDVNIPEIPEDIKDDIKDSAKKPINAEKPMYCQQRAPHIPQGQTLPIGKPVLNSNYTFCSAYGVRNFGTKEKPIYDNHYGFDIGCTAAHYNKPVFTPADGVVERVQPNRRGSSAGNYIVINHKNGFKTYYMHLNTMAVRPGQTVSAGCQIGTIGYTGGAKAFKSQFANVNYPVMRKGISHLHYEIRYTGNQQYVTDSKGNKIKIVHKFSGHKSVDPAYFMRTKK